MRRRQPEAIEVICPTCGLIAELRRPRGARIPRLCDCPAPEMVAPATRPRVCISCTTVLNRYNRGDECGACRLAREREEARAASGP
mgnify:CR=1 FL=1